MGLARYIAAVFCAIGLRSTPKFSTAVERGRYGEDVAAWALRRGGFKVLARNWRSAAGEVDFICRHGRDLVFVEVKTRGQDSWIEPREAVNVQKQSRIAGAAQLYVQQLKLRDVPVRFDIVEVRVEPGTRPAFEIISNAYAARR